MLNSKIAVSVFVFLGIQLLGMYIASMQSQARTHELFENSLVQYSIFQVQAEDFYGDVYLPFQPREYIRIRK